MKKKQNEVEEDFLAGLDKEVDIDQPLEEDLFPEESTETEETKEVTEEEKEEKPLPFHKDPKVQRYIDKQLEKRLKEVKPTETEIFRQEVAVSNPDLMKALTDLVGNDTPEKVAVLKSFESVFNTKSVSKKDVENWMKEVQQEISEKETREVAEAEEELETGFEDIENHYGIELSDKQKEGYKKFLLKIEPRGGYVEYPDFVETFEVFKNYVKANRPSNAQAKVLASRGMQQSSSTNEPTEKSFVRTDGKETLWQKFGKLKETL